MRNRIPLCAVVVFAVALLAAGAGVASGSAAPENRKPPSITGSTQEGAILKSDRGAWRSGSAIAFSFQWRRCLADGSGCADIPKANDRVYTARTADVGKTLRVAVAARNKQGVTVAVSAQTAVITAVQPQVPHNTGLPVIAGTPTKDQALVASAGAWTGTTPIVFSYQWRRCNAAGGDCSAKGDDSPTYRLSSGDVGHALRVLVRARNSAGVAFALSDPSPIVNRPARPAPSKPANTSPPKISGSAQQGQTLKGDRGNWANNPNGFHYSWLRCDSSGALCNDTGAHGSSYTVGSADVGHTIRFKVTATNKAGSTVAFSSPTAVVSAPAPRPPTVASPTNTSPPKISGTAKEGRTLVGDRGSWSNNPTDYDYTWRRCNRNGGNCDGIDGAHATTYTLRGVDVGHTIRFRVKAKNSGGSSTADSAPTAVVVAANAPQNTSPPTISGTPQVGHTLTGNRGVWTHDPVGFDSMWLRCDRAGGSCAVAPGARGSTYALTSADVGVTLRYRVIASNSAGSTQATSVPSAVVQAAPTPTPTPTPTPPRGNGCPGGGKPVQVAGITPPARLLVDAVTSIPPIVRRGIVTLVVRFHVSSTCGGPVQGALVYATATPYNQFSIPPESPTGADGWATVVFRRLRGFPVSSRQQLITMFVRARKPGEPLLGGISTRRLVSLHVVLR